MMLFQVLYQVMVPVLIIFMMGFLLGKFFQFDQKTFSTLSINLLTPALVFQAIMGYPDFFSRETLMIFIGVTLVILITIALVWAAGCLIKIPPSLKPVIVLTLILTNSGNFGLPISEYAFGKTGLGYATLLLVIYVFYTHTLGVFIAASGKAKETGGPSPLKAGLLSMVKVPVFYALLLALILKWFQVELPRPVFHPIQMVGLAAIPVNLLQVGMGLSRFRMNKKVGLVFGLSVLKLAAVPALAWGIFALLGVQGMAFKTAILQIGMPSAVYCSILATHYDGDAETASAIVFVSLLLSVISLTVLITMLGGVSA